jgi:hypothetical protein
MQLHTLPTTASAKLDKEKIIKQTLAMIDEIHEFQYKLFAE